MKQLKNPQEAIYKEWKKYEGKYIFFKPKKVESKDSEWCNFLFIREVKLVDGKVIVYECLENLYTDSKEKIFDKDKWQKTHRNIMSYDFSNLDFFICDNLEELKRIVTMEQI